jgi:hypothetical protein
MADSSEVLDLGVSRPKNPKTLPVVEIFDFSKAAAERENINGKEINEEEEEETEEVVVADSANRKPGKKREFRPQIEEPVFEGGKKAPKLSSKPRSGNRSMTFH